MDEQTAFWLKGGITLSIVAIISVAAVVSFSSGSIIGDGEQQQDKDLTPDKTGVGDILINWNKYKSDVGMMLPAQVNGESVVFIPQDVSAANYGSADVATIGADQDESDTTELFASSEVEEDEDYYQYSTFDTEINSNLPDSGEYKVAIIGTGVGNVYTDVNLTSEVGVLSRDNPSPIKPLDDLSTEVLQYGADADVTNTDTVVYDDFGTDAQTTLALSNDFSSKSDNDVDGSVTLQKKYEVADDRVVEFGEAMVSSVNGNVSEAEMTVMVDGEEVESFSDTDFSDNEGLDDGVEFGAERATDTVTIEGYVEFDDPSVTSATDLVTFELDDTDADGEADDGSYGISALTATVRGY